MIQELELWFICGICLKFVVCQDVNVITQLGTIQGQIATTNNGYQMRAFLGVPYAQTPPVPRFSKPQSLQSLSPNPYNASESKPPCARWGPDSKTLDPSSSEDCLYLKILTPASVTCCIPVMFWIQAGGFNDGGYQNYDNNALGDNFVSKGVILVQINHRQGPLGFFTTGTADAPGNWGVWDSLEALKFVRNNINAFGGDINRITIMGEESGAVMAELLFLSPMANGLFSSVILIDGTTFDPSVIKNDDVTVLRSQRLAIVVGCDDAIRNLWTSGQRAQVVNCLWNNSTGTLVSAVGRSDIRPFDPGSSLFNYYWRPRVDGAGGILPDTFENLASRRPNVPVMVGIMKDDWLSELFMFIINTGNALPPNFNTTYNTAAFVTNTCINLVTDEMFGTTQAADLKQQCIQKYSLATSTLDSTDPYYWLHRAGRVSTGFHLMAPVYKSITSLRSQGNNQVFVYSFDYDRRTDGSYWEASGAFRYLDVDLVANFGTVQFVLNQNDIFVRDLFNELLTNFAKFRDPTPLNYTKTHWTAYGLTNCYLSINTIPVMKPSFYQDDSLFWINNRALN